METSITFPGLPAIVPSARRFVRGILADSPRADDMELIAAELASNAILTHTLSGSSGGEFTLTVRTAPGWARVEVSDSGTGEWSAPRDGSADDQYGRGLAIIAAVADKLGPVITVRVIQYTVHTAPGGGEEEASEVFCLVTDLLDVEEYPALDLACCYPDR